MVEYLVDLEKDLFLLLNSPHNSYLDSVMYVISSAAPWVILFFPFVFLLSYKQNYKEVILLLFFLGLLIFISDRLSSGIIKPIFQRFRPTHHPVTSELVQTVLGYKGGGYGFISGHSTNFLAFALFTSLVIRNKGYTLMIFLTTLTVAYSRIYLGVHFISDVIPGIICGLLVGWFTYWLYKEARQSFLGINPLSANKSFIKTEHRRNLFAFLMLGFYISLLLFSPFVIDYF